VLKLPPLTTVAPRSIPYAPALHPDATPDLPEIEVDGLARPAIVEI
jgi:hypothetical protein